jgi:hypothetical protein
MLLRAESPKAARIWGGLGGRRGTRGCWWLGFGGLWHKGRKKMALSIKVLDSL